MNKENTHYYQHKNDFETYLKSALLDKKSDFSTVYDWNFRGLKSYYSTDIHLHSTLFILVQNGNATLEINHKKHQIFQNDMVLLSFGHFLKITQLSRDFKCLALYITRDYVEEMYSTDMLYKRVKYGIKMYKNPVLNLNHTEFEILVKRTEFIREIIQNMKHLHRKEMTLNALRIFFLDLSNIIEINELDSDDTKPSMDEIYFQKFLDLLGRYYKNEHLVDFYAHQISITPHYLTLIVKKLSGQTVSDFIYQLLFSEAKILLQQPEISIQQIAEQLNFSDQSAFGKFFKRNSGISPREYRKI